MSHPDIPLRGIDHVRFFVGNARQSAYFYRNAFGFDVIAYAGLETKMRQEAGYVLRQGHITFVLISPLSADHLENQRLVKHGDGVMDIALEVEDVKAAYDEAVRRGATGVVGPAAREDQFGVVETATIRTYGDTTHSFINRDNYRGVFAPGFKPIDPERYSPRTFHSVGLKAIDHIVANVEEGKMEEWVRWYERVLGFSQLVHFDDKDISTEYTALMSKVMQNGTGRIKFPINEPAKAKRRSQIDESFAELAELGVLVDRDDEGYMLQIFTKPVEDRPTVFFEIIQRQGSRSFGKGNFKALFEAIEREQARRGTL